MVNYFSQHFDPSQLSITLETWREDQNNYFTDEVELLLVIEGSFTISINEEPFQIHAGCLLQLMPYHVRNIQLLSSTVTVYRIYFSLGLFLLTATNKENYLAVLKKLQHNVPYIQLSSTQQQHIKLLLESHIADAQSEDSTLRLLNLSLVSYISHLFTSQPTEKMPDFQLTWQLIQYLQFFHQESLTPEKVAQEFSISPEKVKASIKKLTSFTFGQILNQVRIRNASGLLQFSDLSINQIAKICGYQNEANFYKQFKLVQQMTPQAYRSQLNHKNQSIDSLDAWEIVSYMLENCQHPLLLKDLVAATNYSKEKINQTLQKYFGLSFKALLTIFRLQMAHTLLISLDLSAEKIGELVGFVDYHTFARNYQSYYHESPAQRRHLND
ncbi:AraC family transcriptional regulator [Enterococcus sp. AZ103]|uniref:AraC family transcriptional regulator n=1 Tax=Enterococcus sp. AZ103 TaxID=2774628 RepID=UPI003F1EE6D0